MRPTLPLLMLLAGLAACGGQPAEGTPVPGPGAGAGPVADTGWTAVWGTAIYSTYPNGPLTGATPVQPSSGVFADNQASNQSLRQFIHPSQRGDEVRFLFSNVFGDRPLRLQKVQVAKRLAAGAAALVPGSAQAVLFSGEQEVLIPPGQERWSDATAFSYEAGEDLAISMYLPEDSGPMSWHAEAFALQYATLPGVGDQTEDDTGLAFTNIERGWLFLAGMDARREDAPAAPAPSLVAFGDSITDGFVGTLEVNHRWPDFLARRLQDAQIPVGVVNTGINSNTVLDNSNPVVRGVSGIERFGRDVLQRSGVGSVFVLLGTNDITSNRSAEEIYAGLLDLRDQARAAGVCFVLSTILPRNDPIIPFGWDADAHPPVREALNARIRQSQDFDAVVDLANAMANPLFPEQPNPVYFAEGLHPNSVGMQALAAAIPLNLVLPPPYGDCGA